MAKIRLVVSRHRDTEVYVLYDDKTLDISAYGWVGRSQAGAVKRANDDQRRVDKGSSQEIDISSRRLKMVATPDIDDEGLPYTRLTLPFTVRTRSP